MNHHNKKLSVHAGWIISRARKLLQANVENSPELWKYHVGLTHAILDARPIEVREFVENFPLEDCGPFEDLMGLAWRVAGNEFRHDEDFVQRASYAMVRLCDSPRKSAEAFGISEVR